MTFGEDHGWGASVETSKAVLTDYLERDGNLIDTAHGYTNGHSEKIIGDYFAARPGLRDRVVLRIRASAGRGSARPRRSGHHQRSPSEPLTPP
ncbi:aldo/keto reductase [Streptomyces sp. NPDC051665]|uniref:aldo/keto reductase n=1 Tax=Streptomyces sp. NPDC051665 TaxID=3154647 RepID=UPI0034439ED0